MTFAEIVFDIYSTVSGTPLISDDNQISLDLIRFKVINVRAQLIRQEVDKNYSISQSIVQTLPCVPFIQVDESMCPCDVPSDCVILRSENRLPRFIEARQRDLVTKVSGPGLKSSGYPVISYQRVPYTGLNKETKDTPKSFFHDLYLYLINPPVLIQKGTVQGVAEDPRDFANYANCQGTPCWNDNSEFPISAHMVPVLKELVLKDLGMLMNTPQDTKADERFNKPNDTK